MKKFFDGIQPAVKQETKKVALCTAIGVLLMWLVFFVLHSGMPQEVPFDYTVLLGGLVGGVIAVLNFFLMGLTVQKVASMTDEDNARNQMKGSYSQRMTMQIVWAIVTMVAPCFQFAAGLLPLLFPSMGIKILGIIKKN